MSLSLFDDLNLEILKQDFCWNNNPCTHVGENWDIHSHLRVYIGQVLFCYTNRVSMSASFIAVHLNKEWVKQSQSHEQTGFVKCRSISFHAFFTFQTNNNHIIPLVLKR